jgi:transposase
MLTPGQAHDAPVAAALLEDLADGATLIADRAYDTNAVRALAAERGAWANIPPRSIRKGSFSFSTWVYRQRNLVERFFNRIKQFRGLATRYDRRPENHLAALKLAAIPIWLAAI